jgi:hypothetical protein
MPTYKLNQRPQKATVLGQRAAVAADPHTSSMIAQASRVPRLSGLVLMGQIPLKGGPKQALNLKGSMRGPSPANVGAAGRGRGR